MKSMPKSKGYTPSEIVVMLESRQPAGYLAATVAAFWPTIKAALLEYEKVQPEAVEPLRGLD